MTDFTYLKTWLSHGHRPVILECVPSRSGLSLSVYDREKLLYRVNGCGFDRYGCALAEFLETLYKDELETIAFAGTLHVPATISNLGDPSRMWEYMPGFCGMRRNRATRKVSLEGMTGIESMREVAEALGLSVQIHETRSSTLLIIQKKG